MDFRDINTELYDDVMDWLTWYERCGHGWPFWLDCNLSHAVDTTITEAIDECWTFSALCQRISELGIGELSLGQPNEYLLPISTLNPNTDNDRRCEILLDWIYALNRGSKEVSPLVDDKLVRVEVHVDKYVRGKINFGDLCYTMFDLGVISINKKRGWCPLPIGYIEEIDQ